MLTEADHKALHDSLFSHDAKGDSGRLLACLKVLQDASSIAPPGASNHPKVRYLCLTEHLGKVRLCKVKRSSKGSFGVGKTWNLDDVRRLERESTHRFALALDKLYSWSVEKEKEMLPFLGLLYDTCASTLHKAPKLVKLDEQELHQYLHAGSSGRRPASLDLSPPSSSGAAAFVTRNHTQRVNPRHESPGAMRSNTFSHPKAREQDERRDRDRAREKQRDRERRDKKAQQEHDRLRREAELQEKLAEQASLMNVEELLTDFNWKASGNAAALEKRLLGELQALEAANVHAIIQSDERVGSVIKHIDSALEELGGMESWLSLYSAELNSMGDDIREIECQNRGLQILTTNQHRLIAELDQLLGSISIPIECLDSLQSDPLSTVDSVRSIQDSAEKLQRVLKTKLEDGLQEMKAVQERMEFYADHSNMFCTRIFEYMKSRFEVQARSYLDSRPRSVSKHAAPLHDEIENNLIKYQGLCLWIKEMEPRKYTDLQRYYTQTMAPLYDRDIKERVDATRACYAAMHRNAEELEYIFRSEDTRPVRALAYGAMLGGGGGGEEGRGHRYLHRLLDSGESMMGGSGGSAGGASTRTSVDEDDRVAEEEFARLVEQAFLLVCREQNFMIDLFQIGPNAPKSFLERGPVFARVPDMNDLSGKREKTKDVKLSKKILEWMNSMFATFQDNLVALLDYGLKVDPTQAVNMLAAVEARYETLINSDQEFAFALCTFLMQRLETKFSAFVASQVKVIETAKVSTKKRRGILFFFRTFPLFAMRLEKAIGNAGSESRTRQMANNAYEKIITAMMASLESIDHEGDQTGEDKEKQNKHILYIENMHHFYHELRTQKIQALEKWNTLALAKKRYEENLNAYIKDAIRKRMLVQLIEFFDGVEEVLQRSSTPEEVSFQTRYNKENLRQVVSKFTAKEESGIKKSLEELYKRVDKHFSEEEGLLQVVWRGIQEELIGQHKRMEELIQRCYPDAGVRLEFTTADLLRKVSLA